MVVQGGPATAGWWDGPASATLYYFNNSASRGRPFDAAGRSLVKDADEQRHGITTASRVLRRRPSPACGGSSPEAALLAGGAVFLRRRKG